jgi:hypothetical protein
MKSVCQNNVKLINRDKLFHNKFRFKATFTVVGARYLSVDSTYDGVVEKVNQIKNKNFSSGYSRYVEEIKHELATIDWQEIQHLINWLDTVNKTEIKMTFAYNKKVTVFYNDENLLTTLKCSAPVKLEEATIAIPIGTKWLKKPAYTYRVYFREQRINDVKLKEQLSTFLESNPAINASGATARWLHSNTQSLWFNKYCRSSYYLEYNEPKYLLVMKLKFNSILGKEYKLEKKPE